MTHSSEGNLPTPPLTPSSLSPLSLLDKGEGVILLLYIEGKYMEPLMRDVGAGVTTKLLFGTGR